MKSVIKQLIFYITFKKVKNKSNVGRCILCHAGKVILSDDRIDFGAVCGNGIKCKCDLYHHYELRILEK